MPIAESFQCFFVERDSRGALHRGIKTLASSELPEGDVTIEVEWSSLNYKDALAAEGHKGVARRLPHIPGIDAAGRVVESNHPDFLIGQRVLVTGYELGAGVWGGWSRYVRVPADWIVPLPAELSPREAMIYGTAGFTAAQCLRAIEGAGVQPDHGPVVVTGATGGVGCLAVMLLHLSGYHVIASTGKKEAISWLEDLGASQVISREDVINPSDRPLASTRWAAGVDTVGGGTLASIIRATHVNGCVTACGMVAGTELPLTVFPFILRGVTLAGITSQNCPMPERRLIWQRFASNWRLSGLDRVVHEVALQDVGSAVEQILASQIRGRVIVKVS